MKPEDQESTSVAVLDPGPDKIIGPGHDYGSVTDEIGGVVFRPFLKTPPQMFIGFACAFLLVNLLMVAVTWLFFRGVGVWGINIQIAWGFAIACRRASKVCIAISGDSSMLTSMRWWRSKSGT